MLEYCGEVLDHKEFKMRVKEYARNKNIHYYFMALKNNEVSWCLLWHRKKWLAKIPKLPFVVPQIIDATLKGNCSRFMNHSCEPNCETQKVNEVTTALCRFLNLKMIDFSLCLILVDCQWPAESWILHHQGRHGWN